MLFDQRKSALLQVLFKAFGCGLTQICVLFEGNSRNSMPSMVQWKLNPRWVASLQNGMCFSTEPMIVGEGVFGLICCEVIIISFTNHAVMLQRGDLQQGIFRIYFHDFLSAVAVGTQSKLSIINH